MKPSKIKNETAKGGFKNEGKGKKGSRLRRFQHISKIMS
jgi:hypothetical protein